MHCLAEKQSENTAIQSEKKKKVELVKNMKFKVFILFAVVLLALLSFGSSASIKSTVYHKTRKNSGFDSLARIGVGKRIFQNQIIF